jgi:hypothetical protein
VVWSADRVHKSGHYGSISPWGMRGKGIGFAERPVVAAMPRHVSPRTGCGSRALSKTPGPHRSRWQSRIALDLENAAQRLPIRM